MELGLGSPAEVKAAFERIRQGLAAKRPGARFDGVAVQAMAAPGLELIVGVTRDDRFGALVMVGLGGVLVEVFKDTALRIAPITAAGARAMLGELRGAALLHGARGGAPADLDAIAGLVAKISEFAAEHAEVREMDLNPVAAYSKGLRVLDARILLDPGAAQSAPPSIRATRAEPRTCAGPSTRTRSRSSATSGWAVTCGCARCPGSRASCTRCKSIPTKSRASRRWV